MLLFDIWHSFLNNNRSSFSYLKPNFTKLEWFATVKIRADISTTFVRRPIIPWELNWQIPPFYERLGDGEWDGEGLQQANLYYAIFQSTSSNTMWQWRVCEHLTHLGWAWPRHKRYLTWQNPRLTCSSVTGCRDNKVETSCCQMLWLLTGNFSPRLLSSELPRLSGDLNLTFFMINV